MNKQTIKDIQNLKEYQIRYGTFKFENKSFRVTIKYFQNDLYKEVVILNKSLKHTINLQFLKLNDIKKIIRTICRKNWKGWRSNATT